MSPSGPILAVGVFAVQTNVWLAAELAKLATLANLSTKRFTPSITNSKYNNTGSLPPSGFETTLVESYAPDSQNLHQVFPLVRIEDSAGRGVLEDPRDTEADRQVQHLQGILHQDVTCIQIFLGTWM